jgi:hypothetical protein
MPVGMPRRDRFIADPVAPVRLDGVHIPAGRQRARNVVGVGIELERGTRLGRGRFAGFAAHFNYLAVQVEGITRHVIVIHVISNCSGLQSKHAGLAISAVFCSDFLQLMKGAGSRHPGLAPLLWQIRQDDISNS